MTDARSAAVASRSEEVRAGHLEFIYPSVKPLYQEPLTLVSGRGVWVEDADSREYLDFFSGILVTSLGHRNEEVNDRVRAQMDEIGHTSTLYLTEPQVSAARRFAAIAPGELKKCFFTNSGTEALETAIMTACLYTGRSEVIGFRYSYHGRSILATNVNAHGDWRPLGTLVPGIKHTLAPYLYRSPLRHDTEEEAAEAFANDLDEVIRSSTNKKPACFLAEPIMGLGGYVVPPRGYFQRAAEIIRSYGGLFIADEVQSGLGRTGKWFAVEHWDVEPDIMYTAKGIANGYPVGVTIAREEIADAWTAKTISTFGGNPICMAATDATLDIMAREEVPARAHVRGNQLRTGLDELFARHAWIGEVRGMGLMQAMELVEDRASKAPSPEKATALLEASRDEGLLIGMAGVYSNVVRFAPSLLITEEEVAEGLTRLGRACARVG